MRLGAARAGSEGAVDLLGLQRAHEALGTELDLGGGNSVLFQGRTLAEFSADDFLIA